MRFRRTLQASLFSTVLMLTGCTGSSEPADTTSASTVVAAIESTPVADSSIPTVPSTDSATTDAATTIAETTTTTPASSAAWKVSTIGVLDSAIGSVDLMAIAPDGRGVAFSTVETSCCSNNVRGWFRSASGEWAPIVNPDATFVKAAIGGPSDVVWFKDRFVAIGSRGGSVEPQMPGIDTTWTSSDGATWEAQETDENGTSAGLTVSPDGSSLVSAWSGSDGEGIVLRSTTDGKTWTKLAELATETVGRSAYARFLTTRSAVAGGPTGYVLLGSSETTKQFVATSSDGIEWKMMTLSGPSSGSEFSAIEAVSSGTDLWIYGAEYVEQDNAVTIEKPLAWKVSATGEPESVAATSGCEGTLQDVRLIPRSPEPFFWAICSHIVSIEGDFASIETTLVSSSDGANFSAVKDAPAEWATPSVDVAVGPITFEADGSPLVAVVAPRTDDDQSVAVWNQK